MTAIVRPSPEPAYQLMKADRASAMPARVVMRSPAPQIPAGKGTSTSRSCGGGPGSGGNGSGVSTERESKSLKAEEPFDLAPDDHGQPEAEGDEHDQDEPEPQSGARHLARALAVRSAPRAMQPVRLLHGSRV